MYFAIRDDDISYFTRPNNLKKIYREIWDTIPISFAVIPFLHGSVKFIPKEYQKDKKYPIGKNKILVKFLKEMIVNEKASIMLHGYSHRLSCFGHEFDIDDNLFEKVKEGKEYLENTFDIKIKSFVAPNHSLSKRGMEAVIKNKLNIVGSPSLSHRPILKNWNYIKNILMLSFFRIFNGPGIRYPYPIKFKTHKELYCYSIVPSVNYRELYKGLSFSNEKKGIFCAAIHSTTINKKNLDLLKNLFNISKRFDVKYVTIDDIL